MVLRLLYAIFTRKYLNGACMKLQSGTTLRAGRYRIVRSLGQGGFGITYLAEDSEFERKVVIKEFYIDELCSRDGDTSRVTVASEKGRKTVEHFRKKFYREAKTIAKLSHPNIIKIYDKFEENETAYYVMEYHPNGSLADKLKANGAPLSEEIALRYVRQVAAALDYIHHQESSAEEGEEPKKSSLRHLDVKPGNIMLDSSGNAVLIDFGLVKVYDEEGNPLSTNTSTMGGYSPGFSPMEQVCADKFTVFSPATDIYALGATLYNLVERRFPPTAYEVSKLKGELPFSEATSLRVRQAIVEAMRPNDEERPQNIAEFLKLIETRQEKPQPAEPNGNTKVKIKEPIPDPKPSPTEPIQSNSNLSRLKILLWIISFIMLLFIVLRSCGYFKLPSEKYEDTTLVSERRVKEAREEKMIRDSIEYARKIAKEKEAQRKAEEERRKKEASLTGFINGHEYVDLGLSVKWATCNVGASSPSSHGRYFAWGETQPKEAYRARDCATMGVSLGDISGNSRYDAARANWKGSWRLPTQAEVRELQNNCQWNWVNQGGCYGCRVIGPSGKSIFLPASGWDGGGGGIGSLGTMGSYWSSTADVGDSQNSFSFYFRSNTYNGGWDSRNLGLSIRPVSD